MSREKNTIYLILYSTIMILLLIGVLVMNSENNENRDLLSFGDIEITGIKSIIELPNIIDDIMMDNFPLRSQAVKSSSFISYKFLNVVNAKYVVLGKDKWLFYNNEYEKTIDKAIGKDMLSQEELESLAKNINRARDYCEVKGSKLLIMIAPSKVTTYPEMLPEYTKDKKEYVMLDQFYEYMKEHCTTTVIDVREKLIAEKENNQLFWKLDTHWNYYGAYVGYVGIMEEIDKTAVVPISDFDVISSKRAGDISKNMLGLGDWITEANDTLEYKNINYTIENPEDGLYISSVDNNDLPTMYFIRDSFGGLIQKYFAPSFKEIYIAINNDGNPVNDSVKERNYDYVVIEVTERSLEHLGNRISEYLFADDDK